MFDQPHCSVLAKVRCKQKLPWQRSRRSSLVCHSVLCQKCRALKGGGTVTQWSDIVTKIGMTVVYKCTAKRHAIKASSDSVQLMTASWCLVKKTREPFALPSQYVLIISHICTFPIPARLHRELAREKAEKGKEDRLEKKGEYMRDEPGREIDTTYRRSWKLWSDGLNRVQPRTFLHLASGSISRYYNEKKGNEKELSAPPQVPSCSLSSQFELCSIAGIYQSITLVRCDWAPLRRTWFLWGRVVKNDPAHLQGEPFGICVWSVHRCV